MKENNKFKSKKEIDDYFSGDEIECLICHNNFKSIGGQHLQLKHGLTPLQYKKKFGLPFCHALECEGTFKKKSFNMMVRRESGDISIMTMTPEKMLKAQHSSKRNGRPVVHALVKRVRNLALKNTNIRKKKSENKINSIDWDWFLEKIKEGNLTAWALRKDSSCPTPYQVKRKLKSDSEFYGKYNDITNRGKLKNLLHESILKLTKEGKSQRDISKLLSISKTHVSRIQKTTSEVASWHKVGVSQ